ncbi:MAG: response regulator transcription factor [Chthoniobacteraceae bacterium]
MNQTAISPPRSAETFLAPPVLGGQIGVAVVEDNAGLRRSLSRIIGHATGMRCVGTYPDGLVALTQLPALKPDVVLMDINMPGMNGIECTERLKISLPGAQVIMVTVYEDAENVFRALQAGACGYLLKRASSEEIISAINEVRGGGAPMTSEIARKVVHAFQKPPAAAGQKVELSQREQEILKLISEGFANKEIAGKLNISYQTVKVHVKHIYEKLHVRSRSEALMKYVSEQGLSASFSRETSVN